jgi:hypothetical protein
VDEDAEGTPVMHSGVGAQDADEADAEEAPADDAPADTDAKPHRRGAAKG